MGRALMLTAPRELSFEDTPVRAPGPGEVRLRSLLSPIGYGTELDLYRGTSAFVDHVFDRELRSIVPAGERSPYPAALGYGLVSVVEQIGSGVEGLSPGDVVHTGTPHRDETIVELDRERRAACRSSACRRARHRSLRSSSARAPWRCRRSTTRRSSSATTWPSSDWERSGC